MMKHIISVSVFFTLAIMLASGGCKKENRAGGNGLPKVVKAQFATPGVMPGDSVRIVIEVSDKEGDQTEIEYEWLVDKSKVAAVNGPVLETDNYGEGARVTVRYRVREVSSGRTTEWQELSLVLGETPPVSIAGVSIEPDPLVMGRSARAVIDFGEADPNDFTFYYRWFINDKLQTGEDFSSEELGAKYLKRGDQIRVEVSENEDFSGKIFRSMVMPVSNNTPVFTSEPSLEINGNTVLVKYEAEDLDGDPLTFSISGTPGGATQMEDGFRFNISQAPPGEYNIIIEADDGKGAKASYEVSLTVPERASPETGPRNQGAEETD